MPGARSSALKAAAKKHSGVSRSAMAKSRVEKETDERRLEARRKEVERFENTANHERFRSLVPLSEHAHRLHPQPPDRTVKMSSRMWKLRMKTWRQCLHDYEEGRELPPPYVSARWVHLLSSANVGGLDDAKCLQPCGEALEWAHAFTDCWRLHRDCFYDPNMHGLGRRGWGDAGLTRGCRAVPWGCFPLCGVGRGWRRHRADMGGRILGGFRR